MSAWLRNALAFRRGGSWAQQERPKVFTWSLANLTTLSVSSATRRAPTSPACPAGRHDTPLQNASSTINWYSSLVQCERNCLWNWILCSVPEQEAVFISELLQQLVATAVFSLCSFLLWKKLNFKKHNIWDCIIRTNTGLLIQEGEMLYRI